MIDQPDGILPIVTFDAQTSWQNLLTLAQPHLDRNGLGRLEAAVGKTARTVMALKLQPAGHQQPSSFMTSEQYRAFSERFQQQVKPDLDRQREARMRSEEAAKRHLVG